MEFGYRKIGEKEPGGLDFLHICQSADDNGHKLNLSGQGFLTILLSFRDSVSRFFVTSYYPIKKTSIRLKQQ